MQDYLCGLKLTVHPVTSTGSVKWEDRRLDKKRSSPSFSFLFSLNLLTLTCYRRISIRHIILSYIMIDRAPNNKKSIEDSNRLQLHTVLFAIPVVTLPRISAHFARDCKVFISTDSVSLPSVTKPFIWSMWARTLPSRIMSTSRLSTSVMLNASSSARNLRVTFW